MTLYLETSAVLGWLLGEPVSRSLVSSINGAQNVVTSNLTFLESKRGLIRLEKAGKLKPSQRRKVLGLLQRVSQGWTLSEITPEILLRAGETFPVEPVRSLDAVHLATALELLQVFPDLEILSLDKRILDNLEPLGFSTPAVLS